MHVGLEVSVTFSNGKIYWSASSFGATQEAYVKLAMEDPNATEMDLLLKGQGTSWSSGVLAVVYGPTTGKVMVWTYEASQGWQQRGADIVVSFGSGDVLGARGYADGTVAVYKNGNLIGTVDVSAWPYYSYGGRIGLETINGDQGYYDDFGGGTLPTSYSPGGSKGLAAIQPAPVQRTKARSRPAGVYKLLLLARSQGEVWRSYYYEGSSRIAMREDNDTGALTPLPAAASPLLAQERGVDSAESV